MHLLLSPALSPTLYVKRGAAKRAFATQPLFKAVVKLLLEQGAEPEFKDKYGQTPLSDE
jgi:ankyrin repeat protein